MPPPSALSIKTSSVVRLIKEEASYHKETVQQKARVEALEKDEAADEYELKQQRKVLEETVVMAPAVRKRLAAAIESLELALEEAPATESADNKRKAIETVASGKKVLEEHGAEE
ncbi:tubulin folding cofactor A [Rhizina undulata]